MKHHRTSSDPKQQSGMTMISLILVLMLIGFLTLLVLKIAPIYLDHYKVVTSLNSLEKEDLASMNKQVIKSLLGKRLDINNVEHVRVHEDVIVTKRPGFVTVAVDYEVVKELMGNLHALVVFTDEITVRRP